MVAVNTFREVRVISIRAVAKGIKLFELRSPTNELLPPASPGAHIDLHLPNGLTRQYSLIATGDRIDTYTICVKREAASRGGSAHLFEQIDVGQLLTVGAPRNNFELREEAKNSILIAGGIGITPILAMLQRLSSIDRPWKLFYACRDRKEAAFQDMLLPMPSVKLHFDSEERGQFLDIERIVIEAPSNTHFYCCGPEPMLEAFKKATAGVSSDRVHFEYFTIVNATDKKGGFLVKLARTGKEIFVEEGKSILDALRENVIDVPYSCEQGICGACETRVLEGIPAHRDVILTEEERASGKTMLICCSGSNGPVLVLDL